MASSLLLSQAAIILALVGMSFGWKGVMTKYAGFYDTQTAWSQVFWGLLLGGVYGFLSESFILRPLLIRNFTSFDADFNVFNILIIVFIVSISSHFMLLRKRVRQFNSQPTSGWALGLAIGAMLSMFFIARILIDTPLSWGVIVNVVVFAIATPRIEALISTYHGHLMLRGRRWGAIIRSASWRILFLVFLVNAVIDPFTWFFILPSIFLVQPRANEWIWDAIPKDARRRLRRVWAQNLRQKATTSPNEDE